MQFRHESVVDLALDLFFSDHEPGQTIIGPLFHSFHSIEEPCALSSGSESLDEVNFGVGALAENSDSLEVCRLHIEVA